MWCGGSGYQVRVWWEWLSGMGVVWWEWLSGMGVVWWEARERKQWCDEEGGGLGVWWCIVEYVVVSTFNHPYSLLGLSRLLCGF